MALASNAVKCPRHLCGWEQLVSEKHGMEKCQRRRFYIMFRENFIHVTYKHKKNVRTKNQAKNLREGELRIEHLVNSKPPHIVHLYTTSFV